MKKKKNELLSIKRRKTVNKSKDISIIQNSLAKEEFTLIRNEHFLNKDSIAILLNNNSVKFKLDKNFTEFVNLKYDIDTYSSFTFNYHPRNILIDKQDDHLSRWSVQYLSQNEYVYLKLEKTSIVFFITFGKYKETHPTNLKEFKVFAGVDKENMVEIVNSGLTNDNDYETFPVKHYENGCYLPCRYIKLVPLRPADGQYNMSIWFINIKGIDNELFVERVLSDYLKSKEEDSFKLCLKLFRRKKLNNCFNILANSIKIDLEAPFTSEVYKKCVTDGDFIACFDLINKASDKGLFDCFIEKSPYYISWRRLDFIDREYKYLLDNLVYEEYTLKNIREMGKIIETVEIKDETSLAVHHNIIAEEASGINNLTNENDFLMDELSGFLIDEQSDIAKEDPEIKEFCPGSRAGHSMAIDEESLIIYLFGGWDGCLNLNDFWSFDIKCEKWRLISENTQINGGPSTRSCMRMVFDYKYKTLYIFGMYKDRNDSFVDSDSLYAYEILNDKWKRIIKSTKDFGGPGSTFDHQMVIDSERQFIYVFGGSKQDNDVVISTNKYLGLWKLELKTLKWENLYEFVNDSLSKIHPRFGHSLIFDSVNNELIIMGGNRFGIKDHIPLFDLIIFNIESKSIRKIFHDYSKENGGPDVNLFTCTNYNSNTEEVFVFGGKFKDFVSNNFWSYSFKTGKWKKAEKVENLVNFDSIILSQNYFHNLNNNNSNLRADCSDDSQSRGINNWNSHENINVGTFDTFNEPVQRFAHQMVYDKKTNEFYLFGGNANKNTFAERLNDFWKGCLKKITNVEILRIIKLKIYKQQYIELCFINKSEAIKMLETKLYPLLNFSKKYEEREYIDLCRFLTKDDVLSKEDNQNIYDKRYTLFQDIIAYFPERIVEPKQSLFENIMKI